MRQSPTAINSSTAPNTPPKPLTQPEFQTLVLESIAEAVCCLDPEGCIVYVNRTAAQLLHVEPAQIIGRHVHDAMHQSGVHSTSVPPDQCPVCRNLRSDKGCFVKHEVFSRLNGTSFPVEYSVRPLKTRDCSYGTVVTFADTTARQIHAKEMLYILTSAKCLLWYGDVEYVRVKGKMRWFVWPADAVAAQRFLPFEIKSGQSFGEAFYACRLDEDKDGTNEYGTQQILAGQDYHQEYRCRRTDSEVRWIAEDVQIEPIGKDRWRAVGVCTDITELKQREHEIEILNERLQRALMETHHRVKNNLQIIVALIDLQTIDRPESLPLAEFTRLSQHVRSLSAIHDLLTMEIKTRGQAESLSARSMLDQLLTTIAQTTGRTQLEYELDDARLTSHQSASLALITNELVANATKHGRTAIRVRFTVREGEATLEICDDGPGFPPEFSPRAAANTGLELIESLTRKDLSGRTRYENRAEGGARVIVQFPIVKV
ncbi:MAG TPA: PAS domain-containing protein [Chthonomonadaceae bacterium]|nr:PAS domain-containing protein [Chthonomonadaceae bacterium]